MKLRGGITMANPESRADVRLEALSLARLRYSFLQDSACRECSFRLMLRLEYNSLFFRYYFGPRRKETFNIPKECVQRKCSPADETAEVFSLPVNGVLCRLHLTLPISLRAVKGISAICVCKFKFSLSSYQRRLQ